MRLPSRLVTLASTGALAATLLTSSPVVAASVTIYDDMPNPIPGNVPSQGFEATTALELGDQVQFSAGSPRALASVTVLLSSWGCAAGHWYSGDCVTPSGATFTHPLTLNIYNVGAGGAVGSLITTTTQSFAIPLRPSASPLCTGTDAGKWYQTSSGTCFNGYATPVTFTLPGVTVPNNVIISITYNTSHYGYAPIGESPACYSSSAGCGYDSLNVALVDPAVTQTVGVNPAPNDGYTAGATSYPYCDGGAGGIGTFRLDPGPGCWTGFKPAFTVKASLPTATNKDQCKNDGWKSVQRANGTTFKNQGDCIQYVNTNK